MVSSISRSAVSGSTAPSGTGWIQRADSSGVPMSAASPTEPGADSSIGIALRCAARDMSMQTLVATRYSQVRSDASPRKRSPPCHARTMVSCTASSASDAEPSIR